MKSPARPPALLALTVALVAASSWGCAAPKAKPKDPASETATNIRLAESYFGAGKVNEALDILEKAAASQPGNAALRNYYGQLSFLAGRNAEAEAAFTKAIELDPRLTDARNNLGALYDVTGRKDLAEREFLKVLADLTYASPEKAHLNLGILYLSQGRQAEAIYHLRQAVEINPKFWRGHFELASALDTSGQLDEAAREYEVAAPDYRLNGEYHYRIGLAYMKLDQPSKAREHFMRCQELAPGSESASKAYDLMKMIPEASVAFDAWKKLVGGLARTREGISSTLRSAFGANVVDEATLDELETSLLSSDLGPALTEEVLGGVRKQARAGTLDGAGLREAMRLALRVALGAAAAAIPVAPPRVVFIVGVNGGGKTTTIGKLAARERAAGRKVVVVAADTFRAAAIDQLERWAERAGVEVVRHREGSDPSAVVFDALRAAKARGIDTVLVDTAGRLHTKAPLMAELEKMARIAGREIPGAPHEVLLVIDATTGQNGLAQAREFTKAAVITGVVLTKLDGTAKGGVALVIRRELGVPIRYVGVGEGLDDLLDFDAEAYLDGLLGGEGAA